MLDANLPPPHRSLSKLKKPLSQVIHNTPLWSPLVWIWPRVGSSLRNVKGFALWMPEIKAKKVHLLRICYIFLFLSFELFHCINHLSACFSIHSFLCLTAFDPCFPLLHLFSYILFFRQIKIWAVCQDRAARHFSGWLCFLAFCISRQNHAMLIINLSCQRRE